MKTMKHLEADEINLISLAANYSDEDTARALLEKMRWPDGPVCPHCKNDSTGKPISALTAKKESKRGVRKGVYFCGACRKQFTVKIGTIFEDSHIPISKWLMAIFILCASKKSISAHQMHRMLKVTYKTAWFMCHRIRFAMGPDANSPKLTGDVEADETFVGGKGDLKTRILRQTPVVALIQRDGQMRTAVVSNVTQKNLGKVLKETVSKDATLHTDEHPGYVPAGKEMKAHHTVNHSDYEFSRKLDDGTKTGINSCESFFSLLKRGVHGSWHHVSREHLPKYAGEFAFRWNNRKVTDGARMVAAVESTEGKRLTYRQAV